MNIAELEIKIKHLVDAGFDANNFIFDFIEIYDAPRATLTKLRQGASNHAKEGGDLLWKNKLFFRICSEGQAADAVDAMAADPLTAKHKPRILLATDGAEVYARDTKVDQPLDIPFDKLNNVFDFFLPLAGVEKYEAVAENPADIRATGRLAKLYDAILAANSDWSDRDHTHELNLFMTRMLFCFFAEDTSIFDKGLFTKTVVELSREDGADTHTILAAIFEAMNQPEKKRAGLPEFARRFPFVNGGLFREATAIPKFSKQARRLLKECGGLEWNEINPDIFGSMIQAVVEPDMRGDMGMHYTSVPNIMKVLHPLFLLSLEEDCQAAWNSETRLKKLLARIYSIRVFDPACGSGNFLIIAYRELRKLETRIFMRLREVAKQWSLPMTGVRLNQFFGIELADFATETAKLSLWIAEYQMNEKFKEVFGSAPPALPLRESGNIVQGNAALVDWITVCPPDSSKETYIAGNPPFEGARGQSKSQKLDIKVALSRSYSGANSLDYVCIWFHRATEYLKKNSSCAAFVATSSICQGQSVSLFWGNVLGRGVEIAFAYTPFKWRNNAKKNAAVNCVIVGIRNSSSEQKLLFGDSSVKKVPNISPYLTANENIIVQKVFSPPPGFPPLVMGNQAIEGGHLIVSKREMDSIILADPATEKFFRPMYGANDLMQGVPRYCIWVGDGEYEEASAIPELARRFDLVKAYRRKSGEVARSLVDIPYRFRYVHEAKDHMVVIPRTTTERKEYISCVVLTKESIVTDAVQVIYDPDMFIFGILSSRIHMAWVRAVAGRFKMDPRYSNTLVYNTFPVPVISSGQKEILEFHAYNILQVREGYPGKTISWLYDPNYMPKDLRAAHIALDEAFEEMFIGRPFKNDPERLEHLFKLFAAKKASDPIDFGGKAKKRKVA